MKARLCTCVQPVKAGDDVRAAVHGILLLAAEHQPRRLRLVGRDDPSACVTTSGRRHAEALAGTCAASLRARPPAASATPRGPPVRGPNHDSI